MSECTLAQSHIKSDSEAWRATARVQHRHERS